jgi:hypothetical protein
MIKEETYVPRADWETIDLEISSLGRRRAQHEYEEGRWMLAARRAAVHLRVGMATFAEYVERRLGYDPRTTHERLRVADALTELLEIREALRSGARSFSAIRELTRVAAPRPREPGSKQPIGRPCARSSRWYPAGGLVSSRQIPRILRSRSGSFGSSSYRPRLLDIGRAAIASERRSIRRSRMKRSSLS